MFQHKSKEEEELQPGAAAGSFITVEEQEEEQQEVQEVEEEEEEEEGGGNTGEKLSTYVLGLDLQKGAQSRNILTTFLILFLIIFLITFLILFLTTRTGNLQLAALTGPGSSIHFLPKIQQHLWEPGQETEGEGLVESTCRQAPPTRQRVHAVLRGPRALSISASLNAPTVLSIRNPRDTGRERETCDVSPPSHWSEAEGNSAPFAPLTPREVWLVMMMRRKRRRSCDAESFFKEVIS
ncbi:hypothetical protein D4764_07G0011300 [Takifugu flavidus]|uniref:Uncharacterized protein n=1 Tax=Takifugu flavidus TaxID=433684 RepID=A0A5C6MWB4_9TELE|nr:hypothetical protein D4764_07G0011300 [Takifugu flavidus]